MDEKLLNLLEVIEESPRVTQRDIATRLGISLGNVNALLHRSMKLGFVTANGSTQYRLTPDGQSEMARLMYHRMRNTITWYRSTRERLRGNLASLASAGTQRIVFYGAGDVADVAYGLLEDYPLELVAIVDDYRVGESFYDREIAPIKDLSKIEYDCLVVTTFRSADAIQRHITDHGLPSKNLFFFR